MFCYNRQPLTYTHISNILKYNIQHYIRTCLTLVCSKDCPTPVALSAEWRDTASSKSPIRIAVAGTTCTDHSAMGSLITFFWVVCTETYIQHISHVWRMCLYQHAVTLRVRSRRMTYHCTIDNQQTLPLPPVCMTRLKTIICVLCLPCLSIPGTNHGLLGPSCRPLAIWLAERNICQEDWTQHNKLPFC